MSQTLRALALIPIVAGLATAILGGDAVRGAGEIDVNVGSELRYYSVFYVGFGLYLWSLAPRVAERGRELRWAAGLLFCGGLARALGIAMDGRPATDYLVLMGIELTLPVMLVLWQRKEARRPR